MASERYVVTWSKDLANKKRKRYADGELVIDRAAGQVAVYDASGSKVGGTRLTATEAITVHVGNELSIGATCHVQVLSAAAIAAPAAAAGGRSDENSQPDDEAMDGAAAAAAATKARPGSSIFGGGSGGGGGAVKRVGAGMRHVFKAPAVRGGCGRGGGGSSRGGGSNGDSSGGSAAGPEAGDLIGAVVGFRPPFAQGRRQAFATPRSTTASAASVGCAAAPGATAAGFPGAAAAAAAPSANTPVASPALNPAAGTVAEQEQAATYARIAAAAAGGLPTGSLSATAPQAALPPYRVRPAAAPPRIRLAATAVVAGAGPATAAAAAAVAEEDVLLEHAGSPPRPVTVGATLSRRLHPHQRDGISFLWRQMEDPAAASGTRGCILADEMGLGKTATAAVYMHCLLRYRRAAQKAVVVCPASLVRNWASEIRRWTPLGSRLLALEKGGAEARGRAEDFKMGSCQRFAVLVVSYEMFRGLADTLNKATGVGLLIADEAHRLKNADGSATLRALEKCKAPRRLLLTGTPLQNDLGEFFALADFACPGALGLQADFRQRFARPLEAARDRDCGEQARTLGAARGAELAAAVACFMLRRTKEVISLSLPPKHELIVFCRPSPRQLALYRARLPDLGAQRFLAAGSGGGSSYNFGNGGDEAGSGRGGGRRGSGGSGCSSCWGEVNDDDDDRDMVPSGDNEGGEPAGVAVLPLISELRKICNHPALLAGSDTGAASAAAAVPTAVAAATAALARGRGAGLGASKSGAAGLGSGKGVAGRKPGAVNPKFGGGGGVGGSETAMFDPADSGKLAVLEALLAAVRAVEPGGRVVLSSNFTSTLGVFEGMARRRGWPFLRLDGSTAQAMRQTLVDCFNAPAPASAGGGAVAAAATATEAATAGADEAPPSPPPFLFLLSARAGGVGLNLVGASRLVLYDGDWNPATDAQTVGRVWRLGQRSAAVHVYRLITTGTLEETMLQRQSFKEELYGLMMGGGKISGGSGGSNRGGGSSSAGGYGGGRVESGGRRFSAEELRELFLLKMETACDTYDKLRSRAGTAVAGAGAQAGAWEDYSGPAQIRDAALRRALEGDARLRGVVSFVHQESRGRGHDNAVAPNRGDGSGDSGGNGTSGGDGGVRDDESDSSGSDSDADLRGNGRGSRLGNDPSVGTGGNSDGGGSAVAGFDSDEDIMRNITRPRRRTVRHMVQDSSDDDEVDTGAGGGGEAVDDDSEAELSP